MLKLIEQKHVAMFNSQQCFYTSFTFCLESNNNNNEKDQEPKDNAGDLDLVFQLFVQDKFSYEWQSEYYTITKETNQIFYGSMPFSLETFFQLYKDPRKYTFKLIKKPNFQNIIPFHQQIGKLIIKTKFQQNPFIIPVRMLTDHFQSKKTITIIIENNNQNKVICSGQLIEIVKAEQVQQFLNDDNYYNDDGYLIYTFEVSDRVKVENIVIMMGNFVEKILAYDKATVKIISVKNQIEFISNLKEVFSRIKSFMQIQNITIIQGVKTHIDDAYKIIFYTNSETLYQKIFRSYLYDKIKDKWVIQGIIHFNRNNKHFQDSINQLSELIGQGEELFPLINDEYYFDQVWKTKAKVIYHILANLKSRADNGGKTLTSFIIDLSKKRKICSQYFFKKLKDSYGLDNIKKIYFKQFVTSIGINKIFYEVVQVKRQNIIKIIIRQKSLACKVYKLYNLYRIKLEQNYGVVSPLIEKIIKKNKYQESSKKKQLSGPLCVPKFLKCIPYFVGELIIQLDSSQIFTFQLHEQNLMEKSRPNTTNRSKRTIHRKSNQTDPLLDTFTWIVVDAFQTFPAIYKNENVSDRVIESMVRRQYQSEHQQLRVLNTISARQHSNNQNLCKILIQKVKIKSVKDFTSISVRRKILQILPMFYNKVTDCELWQQLLGLLRLYQPPCFDKSDEGNLFLHSLIESIGSINYRKQYYLYFQQFHRIFLFISKYHRPTNDFKQEQLRKQLFKSIMNWKSAYSIKIIEQAKQLLQICLGNVTKHLSLIKRIIQNLLPYMYKQLRISKQTHIVVGQIQNLIQILIQKDSTGILFAIKFIYQLQVKEEQMKPLEFLIYSFNQLQSIKINRWKQFPKCLEKFKNLLAESKKRYGLQIQTEHLNQNQNYFLAQYLWKELTSQQSLKNPEIRLQWIKIYKTFYFYFTPIATMVKIKKNCQERLMEFNLSEENMTQIRNNIMDFIPDINWFSVYDSSGKAHKKKVEGLIQNKRKKKFQELTFEGKNYITKFIMENPGKNSWEQLAKHGMKWIIKHYQDKEIDNSAQLKYKQIVESIKNVSSFLKRGNIPTNYNLERLKRDVYRVLESFSEEYKEVEEVFGMIENALQEIQDQKRQRQNLMNTNGTKIMLPRSFLQKDRAEIQ